MNALVLTVYFSTVFGENFQHRIVGGIKASLNQFPYQVSLQRQIANGFYEHYCGGSITAPRYVITAAHCIRSCELQVRAGILQWDAPSTVGQTIKVHRAFVHPCYNDDKGTVAANDIAVLRLRKPLIYSPSVQPIKLPSSSYTPSGMATLSGWGRSVSLDETYPSDLMFAELHIIKLEECKQAFVNIIGTYGPLDHTFICTREENAFGCQGDSGGPLVQNGTLIGVVSFALTPCDITGSPTAYTKVSKYLNWIIEQQQVF